MEATLAGPVVRVLTAAYLISMMLSMGLDLGGGPRLERAEKRRERRLLVRALALDLVVLPLLAYSLTRLFRAGGDLSIAFLLLAACPGGRFAPQLARIARADLALAVEVTLFVAKSVSLTAPLTLRWMLHTRRIEIDELRFIAQLALLQLAPYLLGKALRKRRPGWAERLALPARVASTIAVFLLLFVVLLRGLLPALWRLGDRGWLAVIGFAALSLALGWLVGGPQRRTRATFAIGANARDLALALMIANLAFPGSDSIQPLAVAIWVVLFAFNYGFASFLGHRSPRPLLLVPMRPTRAPQ